MADYYSRTVMVPALPEAALNVAERLLLDILFDSEPARDGEYAFFAREGMTFEDTLDGATARTAIADDPPCLARTILEAALDQEGEVVDVDLAPYWEKLLREIVSRSSSLTHIIVITAFGCSKMAPDGFGGAATVITAEAIDSMSTFDFIDVVLAARLSGKP